MDAAHLLKRNKMIYYKKNKGKKLYTVKASSKNEAKMYLDALNIKNYVLYDQAEADAYNESLRPKTIMERYKELHPRAKRAINLLKHHIEHDNIPELIEYAIKRLNWENPTKQYYYFDDQNDMGCFMELHELPEVLENNNVVVDIEDGRLLDVEVLTVNKYYVDGKLIKEV